VGGIRLQQKKNPASLGQEEAPAGRTCTQQGQPITYFTLVKNSLFSTARLSHVAWTPTSLPNSIVLLGGWGAAELTAEIVPGGGTFDLRHSGEYACGIPDEDTIVMIGGYDPAHNYVTRYNVNGFVEELPQLPENRFDHACAALPSTKAFIVAGGLDGSRYSLSSVLTLLPGAQVWTPLASLPREMWDVRASIVGGKIRLTGGWDGISSRSEVLEYQPNNHWTTVGQLKTGRYLHAVLSIDSEALPCLPGASGTTTSPDPMLFFLIGLFFLCWNQYGLCTNMVKEDSNPKYGTDFDAEARDTNPEHESVDASQGTRAIDQNPNYEPSTIYDSMNDDNQEEKTYDNTYDDMYEDK